MAAILCKPIASCFEFICTAPCKICSGGCKLCSGGIASLCTNPLAAFVMVTFVTQIPIAVAAALELGGLFQGCKGSQWLVGMLAVAVAHMATSVYLAVRVTNRTDEALRDRHSSWQRISYLLCHDPWVAFYILIVIFFVGWLCFGSFWSAQGVIDQPSAKCGSEVDDRVFIALGLGWFYLFLGPAILSCNLCCVCCDKTDYAGDDAEFAAKAAEKEAKKQRHSSHGNRASSSDIESPPPQSESIRNPPTPQPQKVPKATQNTAPSPPRTYSLEGVPIPDDGNANVVEAEVVIDAESLPPPMTPPKTDLTAHAAKVQATKAKESAEKAVKAVGSWWKKKKGDPNQPPETKATVY